ncbi:MAG: co-chaperone DjlA [bacterium]|nr:co-chaperone DjlA [bacterium]
MNFREFFTTNSWWGKLIGALFGYLSGGPFGALVGILIGNFFDKGLAQHFANPHLIYHTEKRATVQKIFFESTFLVMGHIAKIDGRVSPQEIEMAKLLMDEMRLSNGQKILAKRLFNEGKDKEFKLEGILTKLRNIGRDNRELIKLFIDIQYRAASVDGLSLKKIKALDTIFTNLGFAPLNQQYRFYEDFGYTESSAHREQEETPHWNSYQSKQEQKQHHYKPQSPPNYLAHAYALIEVNPQANKQEVKRAYRRLLSRNHPDKLIAQGLPEEMIKIANDKTHKIRKAYELICESKGW